MLLCGLAIVEFLLYRILSPLLRLEAEVMPRWLLHTLTISASFVQHLTAVLALLTVAVALPFLLLRGVLAGPTRLAVAPLLVLFLPLCTLLTIGPDATARLLPGLGRTRAFLYMIASFVTLDTLVLFSLLPRPLPARQRLSVLLLLVPHLLRVIAYFAMARGEEGLRLLPLSDAAALVALGVTPLCFLSEARGERGAPGFWRLPAFAVLVVMGGLALLLRADWEIAQRVLFHGLGVHLTTARPLQGLILLVLGACTFTIAALVQRGGSAALYGYGFLLYGLAGFQLQEGYQLALCLCGLLCLARAGAARADAEHA